MKVCLVQIASKSVGKGVASRVRQGKYDKSRLNSLLAGSSYIRGVPV
jgi:hypothetical protein